MFTRSPPLRLLPFVKRVLGNNNTSIKTLVCMCFVTLLGKGEQETAGVDGN